MSRRKGSSAGTIILVIVLAALICVMGFLTSGFTDWSFKNWQAKNNQQNIISAEDSGATSNKLMFVGENKADDYGIMPRAIGDIKPTITISGNTVNLTVTTSQYSTLQQVNLHVNTPTGQSVVREVFAPVSIAPATLSLDKHFGLNDGYIKPNTDYVVFVEIYYVANGGIDREAISNKLSYRYNAISLPAAPSKEGYTFKGWYLDAACTISAEGHIIFEDTMLYAGWDINYYNITFNTDGGAEVANKSVAYKTVLSDLPTPTKTGNKFLGWYIGDTPYTNQEIKADTELTAKWEALNYTLTFMMDGEVYLTMTVPYGTTITAAMIEAELLKFAPVSVKFENGGIADYVIDNGTVEIVEKTVSQIVQSNIYLIIIYSVAGILLISLVVGIIAGIRKRKAK